MNRLSRWLDILWKAFGVALILSLSLDWALSSQRPTVTYQADPGWSVIHKKHGKNWSLIMWEVPNSNAPAPKYPYSNALLIISTVPTRTSLKNAVAIANARMVSAKLHPIMGAADGDSWASMIYSGKDSRLGMVHLYRVGISDGVLVEADLSFPLVPSTEKTHFAVLTLKISRSTTGMSAGVFCHPELLRPMVSEFNRFVTNLKIGGKNSDLTTATFVQTPLGAKFFVKRH